MNASLDPVQRAAEQAARESYGKLVAVLASRDRDIAAAEDALADAFVAALASWPVDGIPTNPEGWLVTTARNRRKNVARAEGARQRAEPDLIARAAPDAPVDALPDHRLRLMFVCAHPAIDPAARAPLMLQSVLGLEAARIARAFLVEPATLSQRLVRAKARVRDAGLRFELPDTVDLPERLADVLDAIYAAFGQGWETLDHGPSRDGLTDEALFLARLLVDLLPQEPEAKGLLALMLYCHARAPARRDADGAFVPLHAQDARLWNRSMIIEAESLLTAAARAARFGRYQCEAAIQSVHVQRPITGQLNLRALRTLYDLLVTHTHSIAARLGRLIVMADMGEIEAAWGELHAMDRARVATHQPWWVARAHVAGLAGDPDQARESLETAITLTTDPAVRSHLVARHARLSSGFDARGENPR